MKFFKQFYTNFKLYIGLSIGIVIMFASRYMLEVTSTDNFCESCHVHPQATDTWKESTHYKNKNGVIVHCIECHLPPEGIYYLTEKARLGVQDVYGKIVKDPKQINWALKSSLENAKTYTYDTSCSHCHADLFSLDLTPKGVDAHVYYLKNLEQVRCINCHLNVGHYIELPAVEAAAGPSVALKTIVAAPHRPAREEPFKNYTEAVPGTEVTFIMTAIPGGTFKMGSPESESMREKDEGPQFSVRVDSFWIGQAEVSWDEWENYFAQMGRGKREYWAETSELDAVTGPTPPYGTPDQGWGRGSRPAITMTHFAATKYCEWLSTVTGCEYRLPTEAEWEYACRGGSSDAYFFEGNPSKFTKRSFFNKIFGADTSVINRYAWYEANSMGKTYQPVTTRPNPFGLYNMLGNVKEFCLDYYDPGILAQYPQDSLVVNTMGPESGIERVIRGGSYKSDAADLRSAARDFTHHDAWLVTDPQSPKSIWWYSDCVDVGFRIVRVFK